MLSFHTTPPPPHALLLLLAVSRGSGSIPNPTVYHMVPKEGDVKNWLDEAILVNPKIVASGKGKITEEEGCLSFPGMGGKVRSHVAPAHATPPPRAPV